MPTKVPPRVRKTYTHDRSQLRDAAPVVKLVVYIRPDQAAWLAEEEGRRLVPKMRRPRRGRPPQVDPATELAEQDADAGAGACKGRNGKLSEIVREGIDLVIEYARHAEFMAAKLRPAIAAPPAPVPPAPPAPAALPLARPKSLPVRVVSPSASAAPRRWVEGHATRGAQPLTKGDVEGG